MAQDAQLISQAGQVESLASDGLVSVSTGAGQPQKNMELAKFADSLGSSVPLQQTSEQVSITGLYARTSDGKMVELTKESVASVIAGVMDTSRVFPSMMMGAIPNNDCNNAVETGTYFYYIEQGELENSPGLSRFVMDVKRNGGGTYQVAYSTGLSDYEQMRQVLFRSCLNEYWTPWQRVDNFGYNTLAELSSGVAGQMTTGKLFPFMTRGILAELGNPQLDDVVDAGMYVISNNAMYGEFANFPLNVYIPYPGVIVQVVYSTSGIQSRFRNSEGVWTSWSK